MTKQALSRFDYRPLDYSVTHVDLTVTYGAPFTHVSSKLTLVAHNPEATSFKLDGRRLQLKSLKLNGTDWTAYKLEEDASSPEGFQSLVVDVSSLSLDQRKQFTLEVENTFNLDQNLTMSGIYRTGDQVVSQCESHGFRLITFFFDRPDCMSEYRVTLVGEKAKYPYLLSNGNLLEQGDCADKPGYHYAKWHDPFPKPCYLFAAVAGDYDRLEDVFVTKSGRKVDLHLYAQKGKAELVKFGMECLKQAFKWDEDRFGLEYDLDLFQVVAAANFNAGAMENKGLNIFNDSYLVGSKDTAPDNQLAAIDSVLAHEYFHNYTGDRVTCRDWFQLTLKEGLTVFRDQEYTSDTQDRTLKRLSDAYTMKVAQFGEDAGPMSHPIRPDSVLSQDNFYTLTVYEKGAEVIRMIHTLLGEEKFQAGMRLYFQRHDGKAVTCDDFVDAMQDASGVDLTHFRKWYSQSGTPNVDVKTNFADGKFSLSFSQYTKPTLDQANKEPLTLLLKTHLLARQDGFYTDANGNKVAVKRGDTFKNLALTATEGSVVGTDAKVLPELLVFNGESATWTVSGLDHEPLVVTNLDFSSPVRVNLDYDFEELQLLAARCENLYGKANAISLAYQEVYKYNLDRVAKGLPVELPAGVKPVFDGLLDLALESPSFVAEQLAFTTPGELVHSLESGVNPVLLDKIYLELRKQLNALYGAKALELYKQIPVEPWKYQVKQFGYRALKNVLLNLALTNPALCEARYGTASAQAQATAQANAASHKQLLADLYHNADNYTDRWTALSVGLRNGVDVAALEADYVERFADNTDALDRLLQVKLAGADSLEQAKAVVANASHYEDTNPNRVRAAYFAIARNIKLFYAPDAATLNYCVDEVKRCDGFNPYLASHLMRPLLAYNSLVPAVRDLVLSGIERLDAELVQPGKVSDNIREMVTRALADGRKLQAKAE